MRNAPRRAEVSPTFLASEKILVTVRYSIDN